MKIFIDSADIDEIKEAVGYGILDGVTTNPSLIKKAIERQKKKGKKIEMDSYIKDILRVCKGKPVSLEVLGSDFNEMIKEGENLYKKFNSIAKNVYIKIPINTCIEEECPNNYNGIKAIRYFSKKGILVNCTLIFTPEQALLAAKAGAKFVSPFAGRIDDYIRDLNKIKYDKKDYFPEQGLKKSGKILEDNGIFSGVDLVKKCSDILKRYNFKTEVLAASIRNSRQVREVALAGADIATLPLEIIKESLTHYKTTEGMNKFTKDIIPEYSKLIGHRGNK